MGVSGIVRKMHGFRSVTRRDVLYNHSIKGLAKKEFTPGAVHFSGVNSF